jgi:peroxisomal 2,4-dienoyl-CoA reductase
VNGIAPGPIEGTEGVRRLTNEKSRAAALAQCPLGRMGTTDDIANAALYLCSEAASFVNGVTLVVDGGLWLRSARILGEE